LQGRVQQNSEGGAQLVVLKPTRGWRAVNVVELWRFRDLIRSLAIRDIKLRYRQTALGIVWVVLQPILAAGIFSFVFGSVADLPTEGVPYFVFAYAGLLCWNLFSTTVNKASVSLVSNSGMVQKVYFPRISLPISAIPGSVLDFMVSLVVMVVMVIATDNVPGLSVLLLPLWVLITLMLAAGCSLIASALMVHYRDVGQVLPVGLQMLLYISPVAYSLDAVPDSLRSLYSLNPLVGVLEGFRWSLISGRELPVGAVAYSCAFAVGMMILGSLVFARMETKFADVV
jgi:lipopolysaccharide transport system permease protein